MECYLVRKPVKSAIFYSQKIIYLEDYPETAQSLVGQKEEDEIMKTARLTLLATCFLACMLAHTVPARGEHHTNENGKALSDAGRRVIDDFGEGMDLRSWEVEDDVVMGGRSKGAFSINDDGHAVFSGDVSLENNGGFSSVQHYFDPVDVSPYRTAFLRLKGDGKSYQFLIETERNARHYYVYEFQTTHGWQTVKVPLAEMYPAYRGERLTIPNYSGHAMAMVRFLIANKKSESFRLEIDSIWLE